MKKNIFPFTAIVGQEKIKKALILNAINPSIGGVLIKGDRGTGKTTAVRALADLLSKQAIYKQSIEENIDKQQKIIDHLDSHFQLQKENCLNLIKEKNEYERLFQNLNINAKNCNDSFIAFHQKLDNTNSSFKYNSNASVLLHDLESSFHLLYTQNSQTLMKEIDDIASNIINILYKCSSFPEYLKPINNIIDHYSFKIDTTLNSFVKENERNTMNHEDLVKALGMLSKTILNFETEIEKILGINEVYLNKNIFVISKILEIEFFLRNI